MHDHYNVPWEATLSIQKAQHVESGDKFSNLLRKEKSFGFFAVWPMLLHLQDKTLTTARTYFIAQIVFYFEPATNWFPYPHTHFPLCSLVLSPFIGEWPRYETILFEEWFKFIAHENTYYLDKISDIALVTFQGHRHCQCLYVVPKSMNAVTGDWHQHLNYERYIQNKGRGHICICTLHYEWYYTAYIFLHILSPTLPYRNHQVNWIKKVR